MQITEENKKFLKRVIERNLEILGGSPFRVRDGLWKFTKQLQDLTSEGESGGPTVAVEPQPTTSPAPKNQ